MLEIEKIYKRFGHKAVLKGVTFKLLQGDFITIIGRIGSGKSTILNIIAGLISADAGSILYKGQPVNYKDRAYIKDIGFLLSQDYLLEEFSAVLYWKSISKLLNMKSGEANTRIEYILDLLNVSDPIGPISHLSSGNKMLVKFGTMLLGNPKVLIIDEPFIHLDILEVQKIENILTNFSKDGNTILMTTHFPEPLFKIGNKLIILENGIITDSLSVQDYKDYDGFKSNLAIYFKNNSTSN